MRRGSCVSPLLPLQEEMSGGKIQPCKRQVRVCSFSACKAFSCPLHVCSSFSSSLLSFRGDSQTLFPSLSMSYLRPLYLFENLQMDTGKPPVFLSPSPPSLLSLLSLLVKIYRQSFSPLPPFNAFLILPFLPSVSFFPSFRPSNLLHTGIAYNYSPYPRFPPLPLPFLSLLQGAPREGHSDEEQSKRARTPEATAAVAAAAPVTLDSTAFTALNAELAASTCQSGQEGALVGLLPGLRSDYMQRYEKETKKHRAPREDLSGLTAEEKVERRKARARVYSNHARKRDEARKQALVEDVDMMQLFRHVVEDAPHMIAVVSPDLDCTFRYANEAFARILGFLPHRLLTRPRLGAGAPRRSPRVQAGHDGGHPGAGQQCRLDAFVLPLGLCHGGRVLERDGQHAPRHAGGRVFL